MDCNKAPHGVGLWATSAGWSCPCSLHGGWTGWSLWSLPIQTMLWLWFCNSMIPAAWGRACLGGETSLGPHLSRGGAASLQGWLCKGRSNTHTLLRPVMLTLAPAHQEAAEKWPGRAQISPLTGLSIPSLADGEHSFTWCCYGVPALKRHWKFTPSAAHPPKCHECK